MSTTLAVNEVAIRDHVAHGDRDPKLDPSAGRRFVDVLWHFILYFDGAAHRIDNAVELDQQAITHGSHNPASVRGDRRVDEIAPDGI